MVEKFLTTIEEAFRAVGPDWVERDSGSVSASRLGNVISVFAGYRTKNGNTRLHAWVTGPAPESFREAVRRTAVACSR